jgi:hypothetical protein
MTSSRDSDLRAIEALNQRDINAVMASDLAAIASQDGWLVEDAPHHDERRSACRLDSRRIACLLAHSPQRITATRTRARPC